jgi:hypothetical protein
MKTELKESNYYYMTAIHQAKNWTTQLIRAENV